MRFTTVFALLLCFLAQPSSAQFSKDKPIKLTAGNIYLGYYSLSPSSDALITNQLKPEQVPIVSAGMNRDVFPPNFKDYNYAANHAEELGRYKAYVIAEWADPMEKVLIWVPRDENLGMPEGLVPPKDPGFFIVERVQDKGYAYLNGARAQSTASSSRPARMVGTMAVAYGPEDGGVTKYYLYEVYASGGIIDGDLMLKNLKKETRDMKYKQHKFYMNQSYAPVIKLFPEQLSRREAKRADRVYGGQVNDEGIASAEILHPQHPTHDIKHSTADMSQYVTKEAPPTQQRSTQPQTKYRKCTFCEGKGYNKITSTSYSNIGGTGTVGRTGYVDWQRAPTSIQHKSTDYKKCEKCGGSGQVPE